MGHMSDTGEQGVQKQDPADKAGVGGGLVPDDQSEGYAQAAEAVQDDEPPSDEPTSDDSAGG